MTLRQKRSVLVTLIAKQNIQLDKMSTSLVLRLESIQAEDLSITLDLGLTILLLFIGSSKLGDEGAKEIGFALKKNNALAILNIGRFFLTLLYSLQNIIILDMKEQRKQDKN
eukprot:TRINITY_DN4966_c0_g2_i2.p2 TRINITY_DN4966_c0_g2~~TRINITY_DN4966_c0_g2_i2.p2  ORF type:complete len:112 (+),score=3.88 TRINITY_DN4966_c0_g2_i2:331-666(+)